MLLYRARWIVGLGVLAILLHTSCNDDDAASNPGDEDRDAEKESGACTVSADCEPGWVCGANHLCIRECCDGDAAEDETETEADLAGEGEAEKETLLKCPILAVSNQEINFGTPLLAEIVQQTIKITNDSNFDVDLEVRNISYDSLTQTTEFMPNLSALNFPIVLKRGESFTVGVDYSPADPGEDQADLLIFSDDCERPVTTIKLVSHYQGEAKICINPATHDFGNTDVGAEPKTQDFRVCNCGSGNKVLTLNEIRFESANPNFQIKEGAIPPVEMLVPGTCSCLNTCHDFTVQYKPTTATDTEPHSANILVVNDADEPADRTKIITVQGRAEATRLSVTPDPVDFGTAIISAPETTCTGDQECPWSETCNPTDHLCYEMLSVTLYNWTPNPVWIQSVELTTVPANGDTGCDAFSLGDLSGLVNKTCEQNADCPFNMSCLPEGDKRVCHLEGGVGNAASFTVRFRPKDTAAEQCTLLIRSDAAGMVMKEIKIMGQGRLPNYKPVARISLHSHGDPIEDVIEGETLAAPLRLCFYGDISTDEDGAVEEYVWNLTSPTGSGTHVECLGAACENMCLDFDLPGEYRLELKVRDNEGAWSNPAIVTVKMRSKQDLKAVLSYEACTPEHQMGSNKVNMDLLFETPNGAECRIGSAPGLNAGCPFGGSGTEQGASETLRLDATTDGVWTISVKYENCCADWLDALPPPRCRDRMECNDNAFRIELFDPKDNSGAALCDPLVGELDCGQTQAWRFVRMGGVWVCPPVPM